MRQVFFLWLAPVAFLIGIAVSLGISWARDCYASSCTEVTLAFEERIHIAVFYAWLLITGAFLLTVRRESSWSRFWDHSYKLSFGSWGTWHPNRSEFLFWAWLFGLLGLVSGLFWLPRIRYFERLMDYEQSTWSHLVAYTGMSGHWCDVLLGLVFISIGRNSTLAHLFLIPVEHSIYYHKMISYLLLFLTLAHMVPYYVSIFGFLIHMPDALSGRVNVDNPYYSSATITIYQQFLLGTGVAAFVFMIAIAITSRPSMRANNYNIFYFTHFLFVGVLILACYHASSDFYLVLPGLISYLADGISRFGNLQSTYRAKLIKEPGNDNLLRIQMIDQPARLVSNAPFYYYIQFAGASFRELHPFTSPSSVKNASEGGELSFLLRPVTKKSKKPEWTQKLMSAYTSYGTAEPEIRIKLEGPYSTPIPRISGFDVVLCVVGGTGITGALSLGHSVLDELERKVNNEAIATRCVIVWSTREEAEVARSLFNIQNLMSRPNASLVVELHVHNTREAGRLDAAEVLQLHLKGSKAPFVYTSGPVGLMESVALVCRENSSNGSNLLWHEAKWDS